MADVKLLSKAEETALLNLNAELQKGFDNGSFKVRFWNGKVDMKDKDGILIVDKATGEVKKKDTKNMTLACSEELMVRVKKSFEVLKGSGKYVSLNVFGKGLNAISTRYDELRQLHTIQFTEPTQASWNDSNSDAVKESFRVLFGEYKAPQNAQRVNAPVISENDPF